MTMLRIALLCALAVGASSLRPTALGAGGVGSCAVPAARRSPAVCMGRKGRPTMPQGMQGGYAQGAQQGAPPVPPDGTPIFYLYCRTGPGKPSYPVSAMKGDGQSKAIVNAWLGSPFAKGVFKDRLDEQMARSIFDSERRLAGMACEQYKQLKDSKARLQWGFKILQSDLVKKEASGEMEKQGIVWVNRGMIKEGILAQAQKATERFLPK